MSRLDRCDTPPYIMDACHAGCDAFSERLSECGRYVAFDYHMKGGGRDQTSAVFPGVCKWLCVRGAGFVGGFYVRMYVYAFRLGGGCVCDCVCWRLGELWEVRERKTSRELYGEKSVL